MPRSLLLLLLPAALAAPARADTCDWVNSVASWDASLGWSWSNGKYSWTQVSVWPVAETCAALATEVACGAEGASVPVQAGVALYVQVRRSTNAGTGSLQIHLAPEPNAAETAAVACAGLACLARGRRGQARSA